MDNRTEIQRIKSIIGQADKPKQSRFSIAEPANREWFEANREKVEAVIGKFELDDPNWQPVNLKTN